MLPLQAPLNELTFLRKILFNGVEQSHESNESSYFGDKLTLCFSKITEAFFFFFPKFKYLWDSFSLLERNLKIIQVQPSILDKLC